MKFLYVITYLSMQLNDDEAQLHTEPANHALVTTTKLATMLKIDFVTCVLGNCGDDEVSRASVVCGCNERLMLLVDL